MPSGPEQSTVVVDVLEEVEELVVVLVLDEVEELVVLVGVHDVAPVGLSEV